MPGAPERRQGLAPLQDSDHRSGHIAVTGAWRTHHYQQVPHTHPWEQPKHSLACIPMASHSKQKLKDLVNCCFYFFFFHKPACPCRSFTKGWAFIFPVDILWKGECQWKLDLLMNNFCGRQVRWKFMKDLNLSLWPWTNSTRKEKAANAGRKDR